MGITCLPLTSKPALPDNMRINKLALDRRSDTDIFANYRARAAAACMRKAQLDTSMYPEVQVSKIRKESQKDVETLIKGVA